MKNNVRILSIGVALAALLVGCGGGEGFKRVVAGSMPAMGNWDGVYHSEAYGRMELSVNGETVIGLYEKDRDHGKIEGTAEGDLLTFKWTQWNEDLNGKVRKTTGHGFFRYVIKEEGTAQKSRPTHYAEGEWGYLEANAGNPWASVRLPEGTKKILTAEGNVSKPEEGNKDPFASPAGSSSSSSSSSEPASSGGGSFDSGGGGGLEDDVNDLF